MEGRDGLCISSAHEIHDVSRGRTLFKLSTALLRVL